ANTLKQYLRYAAAASAGQEEAMHQCLGGPCETRGATAVSAAQSAVAAGQPAEAEQKGKGAGRKSGTATPATRLRRRNATEDGYARASVVDSEEQYASTDVVERHVTRPAIFRTFGWEVEQVLGKDWVLRAGP